MNHSLLIGLKRASWLFAAIVGVITMTIVASGDWDCPEDYLPLTIAFAIISFILFRMGIWVVKGFIGMAKSNPSNFGKRPDGGNDS